MEKRYFKKGLVIGIISGAVLGIALLGAAYFASKTNLMQSKAVAKSKNFKELGLTLKDLDGKAVELSQFHGKKVLVNFWGTWCAPCVKEMPSFQEIYRDKKIKENYVFLLISDEEPEKIEAFKKKNGYDFVFVKSDQKLMEKIGVFPTTFILDQDFNIVFKKTGSFEGSAITELKELLSKK